jgi:thiol-disulfide isomerase/thioredoxin
MSDQSAAKPKAGPLTWALWGVALLGVAAVVYIMAQVLTKPGGGGDLKSAAQGEMAKLVISPDAGAAPATSFQDATGKPVRIADFKGKVVVVNLWATWCAPCLVEMPTLAKLKQEYAGRPLEVVAISIDTPSAQEKARAFIARHAPLDYYADPSMKLSFAFTPPATSMPTTVIYGADGVERGRLSGGADWSGPDAKALLDRVLAEK